MMVKAAPSATLVVSKPEFLLEVLIIALDPPASLRLPHEFGEGGVGREGGEPVLRRLFLTFWPLDQTPFLGTRFRAIDVAMGGADAHGGEARGQPGIGALAPGDTPPCRRRQADGEFLCRDRLVFVVAAQKQGWTPATAPWLRWQRAFARWPERGRGLDADDIQEPEASDAVAKVCVHAVAGVSQHHGAG